ncbi:MAG: hypothetical protein DRI90_28435, partial [Deltaproteobacteria bacterium]
MAVARSTNAIFVALQRSKDLERPLLRLLVLDAVRHVAPRRVERRADVAFASEHLEDRLLVRHLPADLWSRPHGFLGAACSATRFFSAFSAFSAA